MDASGRDFHLFPQLPTEIRLAIWRLCLPKRVYELDVLDSDITFVTFHLLPRERRFPCCLDLTSALNARPPVITRVCRESRQSAFETGSNVGFLDGVPPQALWTLARSRVEAWVDRSHDTAVLNWSAAYQDETGSRPSGEEAPMRYLAWQSSRLQGEAALTMGYFDSGYDWLDDDHSNLNTPLEFDLATILSSQPSWLIVMRTIVVHDDSGLAASTGLFGLLGDAHVQVVDVRDSSRVDAFYDLAKRCESQHDAVEPRQSFLRRTPEKLEEDLTRFVYDHHRMDKAGLILKPAIMFRLCPLLCNHVDKVRDPMDLLDPRSESARIANSSGRGRGRGRGRNGGRSRGG